MSTNCEIILQWSATPEQLTALGSALWRWCSHAAGATGMYQHLDNQALADLVAGKFPASGQTSWRADGRGIHFAFQGAAAQDRRATIGSLRKEIPAKGVEDVVINGKSWDLID